jgi:hypothetical protein
MSFVPETLLKSSVTMAAVAVPTANTSAMIANRQIFMT